MRAGELIRSSLFVALLAAVALGLLIASGSRASAGKGPPPTFVTVAVGDDWFCNPTYQGYVCETLVTAGQSVIWDFSGSSGHTSTACGASCDSPTSTPLWDSGFRSGSSPDPTFSFTFTEPGSYLYYCQIHPFAQRGVITVLPAKGRLGDVNCDERVNSIDAALVLQLGAGLVGSLSCQDLADLNGDGRINSIDAALILQIAAGLLPGG